MINIIKSSTLAGIAIGLATMLYVSVSNIPYGNILGALLFGFALLYIVEKELWLFTGRVGIILRQEKKKEYILNLLVCLIFNAIGVLIVLALAKTVGTEAFQQKYSEIYALKINYLWYISCLKGIGCGMLIYMATKTKKESVTIISVAAFLILGFQHCIADVFYLGVHYFILIIAFGNALGAIFMDSLSNAPTQK